ncbi:MAG: hypothetical protein VX438_12295 [Planctomycetota bacterium]|nr:hypothetical protein [Planctomycetota bacterium]
MKNPKLFSVLRQTALADKEKALMSLELLSEHPAGIGDHSTGDFYKSAEEALALLVDAEDRLETLGRYFPAGLPERNGELVSSSVTQDSR